MAADDDDDDRYYGLTQLSRLATWLGKEDDAKTFTSKAAAMKRAFNKLFIDIKTGAVCDGMCSEIRHTSVHSSFYALAFGLIDTTKPTPATVPATATATATAVAGKIGGAAPAENAESIAQGVWNYIKQRIDGSAVGVPCGAYPVQFLLLALYQLDNDRGAEAFKVLTSSTNHSWIAMMDVHNATTTMECWEPEELPNLTFSHIWSASPSFIIPWFLVGIRPLLPGWAKVSIKPAPGALTQLSYTQPTVKGPIQTKLTQIFGRAIQGNCTAPARIALLSYRLEVVVPGNMVARLHVPAAVAAAGGGEGASDCIKHNGAEKVGKDNGVSKTEQGAHVWIEVGSGTHTVEICT